MTDLTVANEILAQLGGRMFTMMTGSKNYVGMEKGLMFKVGSGAKSKTGKTVNKVIITLNANDLYDIEFGYLRGVDYKVIESRTDVFVESLRSTFTECTGFDTSLGRR